MLAFVLISVLAATMASALALLSGSSFLGALALYVGVGVAGFALILLRAFICLHLSGQAKAQNAAKLSTS